VSSVDPNYLSALEDFTAARRKASIQTVLAHLGGKSNELLSFEEVARKLRLHTRREGGIHDVPIKAVVGSVGRVTDFTRDFLPLKTEDQHRWARVKAAMADPENSSIPPIELYKIGDAYFVLDGNHRISIARQDGLEFIEAHVIEINSDIPLSPGIQPDDLIIKAEYADFLEQTNLTRLRPGVDLTVSVPGQYRKLLEHINIHRYFMGIDLEREIPYEEAVTHWYDTVYLPVVDPILETGTLHWFSCCSETDLYVWVLEHRAALEQELGWQVRTDVALADLALAKNTRADVDDTGRYRKTRMFDRYTDRLFKDILVPINGSAASWQAVDQAVFIAQKENATLHGMYVRSSDVQDDDENARLVKGKFDQHCEQLGILGNMAVVKGKTADQIYRRSLLTDLIVMKITHPPKSGFSSIKSGLRSIIWRSARPILAIPREMSDLNRILVGFDGSEKSKEALFIATYLAEKWKSQLTILTISEHDVTDSPMQDYARAYCDIHEIPAEFITKVSSLKAFTEEANNLGVDLIVVGGYGGNVVREFFVGSLVNLLLREAACPIMICR
jgi:nucleotide-binding universal stress UspA family protein